jgi:hypothetical protein
MKKLLYYAPMAAVMLLAVSTVAFTLRSLKWGGCMACEFRSYQQDKATGLPEHLKIVYLDSINRYAVARQSPVFGTEYLWYVADGFTEVSAPYISFRDSVDAKSFALEYHKNEIIKNK